MVKATSMSVEFDFRLTREEIERLETQALSGILNHNEQDNSKRKIPFFIIYSHQDLDQIAITGYPNGYLGNADTLWFTIFNYHYEKLKENGNCGDRIDNSIRIRISKHT